MIKGISRNVVEIVQTESDLFERAILFVRPGGRGEDPARLEEDARSFLAKTKIRRRVLSARSPLATALQCIFSAGAGAGLAAFFLLYL